MAAVFFAAAFFDLGISCTVAPPPPAGVSPQRSRAFATDASSAAIRPPRCGCARPRRVRADRRRYGTGPYARRAHVSGLESADQDVEAGYDGGDGVGVEDGDALPDDVLPVLVDPRGVAAEGRDVVPAAECFGDDTWRKR
ncbi:hypothetical protein ACVWXB_000138 [Streptomyces sp. TE12347]